MTVRVITTPPADEHILTVSAWWRQHRPAVPDLFDDELIAALELLAEQPEIGERDDRLGVPELRRLPLKRSRYHVYYL